MLYLKPASAGSLPPGFKLPPKPPTATNGNLGSPSPNGSPVHAVPSAVATVSPLPSNMSSVALLAAYTRRSPQGEYFFDPIASCDVFPPRAPDTSYLADFVLDPEGAELQADRAHPLGWVPGADQQLGTRLRPRTGQLPVRTNTSMPLEYFDSPEMELVPPEERLAAGMAAAAETEAGQAGANGNGAGQGAEAAKGVLGYSRYFDAAGTFTWAPCYVQQYDR